VVRLSLGSHHWQPVLTSFSSWYKRSEFGVRAAIFFSAATVSGAFGGLLAVRVEQVISDSILANLVLSLGSYFEDGWYWGKAGLGMDFQFVVSFFG